MGRHINLGPVKPHVLECLPRGQRHEILRRHRHEGEIDVAGTCHHGLFLIGDTAAAVAIHDAETAVERDQIRDCALPDHAGIRYAARPDLPFLRLAAPGSGLSAPSAPSMTVVTRGSGWPWRARIGSTEKPSNLSSSPPRPVTVRICVAGTCWAASLSVVTGAPTIIAPVRKPTEAASDM